MKEKENKKFPTSVKLDAQVKNDFDDWLWLNRDTFSRKVNELVTEFLKANPLSKGEKALVEKNRKAKI